MSYILHIFMILNWLNLCSGISKWTPVIPPECENENICDMKISNYPKRSFINRTIKKLQQEGYVIGLEKNAFEPYPTLGPNDIELCRSVTRNFTPNAARDAKTNDWRFVINDPDRPVQIVTLEICSEEYAPCDNLDSESFIIRPGYQARCVQKFFHKSLLGYSETGQVTQFLTHLPMCCACVPLRVEEDQTEKSKV